MSKVYYGIEVNEGDGNHLLPFVHGLHTVSYLLKTLRTYNILDKFSIKCKFLRKNKILRKMDYMGRINKIYKDAEVLLKTGKAVISSYAGVFSIELQEEFNERFDKIISDLNLLQNDFPVNRYTINKNKIIDELLPAIQGLKHGLRSPMEIMGEMETSLSH